MAVSIGELVGIIDLDDSKFGKGLLGAAAKVLTFGAAIAAVNKAFMAQSASEESINKLNLALSNQGIYTDRLAKSLNDYAGALMRASIFGDEEIRASEALLVSFGMNEEQIKRTMQAAADFAAVSGTDLGDAVKSITKGVEGQGRAFKAYGVTVTDSGSRVKNLDSLLGQLESKFSGSALQATESYAGSMKQLRVAIDEAWEGLGKFLGYVTSTGGKPFAGMIESMRTVQKFLGGDLIIAFSEARALFAEFIAGVFDTKAKVADFIGSLPKWLGGGQQYKDSAAMARLAAEDQRKYAMELRATGDAAAVSEGNIKKFGEQTGVAGGRMNELTEKGKKAAEQLKKDMEDLYSTLLASDKEFHSQALETWDEWGKRAEENIDKIVSDYMRISGMLGPTTGETQSTWKDLNTELERRGGLQQLNNAELTKYVSTYEELAETGKLTDDQLIKGNEAIYEYIDRNIDGINTVTEKTIDWGTALQGVALLADTLNNNFGGVLQVVGNIGAAFDSINKNANLDAAGKNAAKLSAGLLAVSQIGKIIATSTNPALEKLGSTLQGAGAAAGSAASSGAHPLVIALAGVVGGIMGFLGASSRLRAEMQKLTQDFVKSQGGLDSLKSKATEAGISLDQLFKAKTAEQLIKAIDIVKAQLDTWNESNEKLQAAIEKYAITVEELGPKFAQQQMDKQALQLIEDWKLLAAAGVDVNTLITKMGPALLDFVNQSIKAGTTIPEAMRPMVEGLITSGQLLDENGNAFASVEDAGITFAQTMTEQFQTLIGKINELVNALLGIPTNISTDYTFNRVPEGTPSGDGHAVPRTGADQSDPDVAAASGFYGKVTKPTTFLAGEAGPEIVDITPQGRQPGGGGNTFNITLKVDENPMQTAQTVERMRDFTLDAAERKLRRNLTQLIASGRA